MMNIHGQGKGSAALIGKATLSRMLRGGLLMASLVTLAYPCMAVPEKVELPITALGRSLSNSLVLESEPSWDAHNVSPWFDPSSARLTPDLTRDPILRQQQQAPARRSKVYHMVPGVGPVVDSHREAEDLRNLR